MDPVALGALAVLILNDQVLKAQWPGLVTGKLSDIAGLVVAPLALQAGWEVLAWAADRWYGPSQRVLALAIVVVGALFSAIQVWPPAAEAYRWGLGALQWPFSAALATLQGVAPPSILPVSATADAADLLALPALGVAWWLGRRRTTGPLRPRR